MEKKKAFSKGDLILILVLALAAASIFLFRLFQSSNNLKAEITVDGVLYETVDLSGKGNRTFKIENTKSGINCEIKAEKGEIYFVSSLCPDKICVNTGKLSHKGDTAACLPAGVIIKVTSGKSGADVITF